MYPKDKRPRFIIGAKKGMRRALNHWIRTDAGPEDEYVVRDARLLRNRTTICGCSWCRKDRKDMGPTFQEKKKLEATDNSLLYTGELA